MGCQKLDFENSTSHSGLTLFTHDNAGNPTSYRGMGFEWQNGRQLKTITGANQGGANWGTISMEYDYNGLRTKKLRQGGNSLYYWQGDQLLAEDRNGQFLYFYYDETGVSGMSVSGSDYFFRKNLLGDITDIYNRSGQWMGGYKYDAYGKVLDLSISPNDPYQIATWNPFRYRGYYQDQETGFYYLQSRYYDPTTGRFINADNPLMLFYTAGMAGGANLYAYCLNNPVMMTDSSGCGPLMNMSTVKFGHNKAAESILTPSKVMIWAGVDTKVAMAIESGIWVVVGGVLMFVPGAQGAGAGFLGAGLGGIYGMGIGNALGNAEIGWGIGSFVGGIAGAKMYTTYANGRIFTNYGDATTGTGKSWSATRQAYWKGQANDPNSLWYANERALRGLSPTGMVLHHPFGRAGANMYIFEPMTATAHMEFHRAFGANAWKAWIKLFGG